MHADECGYPKVTLYPRGGVEYLSCAAYDLRTMLPTGDFCELLGLAARAASNIVCILPRNTRKAQLEELSLTVLDRGLHPCLVEDVYLWGKCKMTIAYFGLMFAKVPKLYLKRKLHEASLAAGGEGIVGGGTHIRFEEQE